MSVIGFDIGNENCVIAVAKRGGVDVLLNDEAKRETPSVVSFGEKQRSLGSAGAAFATANPKSTISQIKRLIGKVYKEVEEELKMLPFVTSEGPRGGVLIEIEYMKSKWSFTPVEILGMLFKHLKQIAEKNLESSVADCVIGIPSYFTDLQRRLYLDAAHIAGLTPLRLMHDGTAIALGYGMYKTDLSTSGPTHVMFVDIGQCDTQVTVAAFEQGKMKILSHSFDSNLGGRDFDEVLFKYFAALFNEKYKIDVYSNARASVRLRASCEKVKKVLSANAEAPLSIECLIGDTDVRGLITREEFENLSTKLLERVIVPCKMALKNSGLSVDKLYTIELVGSGSRIPAITRILTSFLKKEPTRTLNASECVARGCALFCAKLSPTLIVREYKILESFPYSIVIPSSQGEYMVFSKGSSFPKQETVEHFGKTQFQLQVEYIKGRDFPAGISHIVGHFGIGPSEPSDAEKVEVQFKVELNSNGIVEINFATILEDKLYNTWKMILMGDSHMLNLPTTGNVNVSTTNDELHEAKQKEKTLTEQDIKVERTKDQRNTLESFVYETRSKLSSAYRSFATDSEKEELTNKLQETEDWLYEDSDDESEQDYDGKLVDLKKLLEPIENRYVEENAIAKATKTLQTCIAKYRSHADSLPTDKKHNVKNVCIEAERWFSGLSQKQLPPKTLLNEINRGIGIVERECKSIIRSKSSSSRHERPVDSNQKDQTIESDQLVDSENAMAEVVKPLQACIAHYLSLAESLPADKKEKIMNVFNEAEKWLNGHPRKISSTDINQAIEYFASKCEIIISSAPPSSKHEEPKDSDQRDQPVDSDQRDQTIESDQLADFENAMAEVAKPLQACIAHYFSLAESLPADKKEKIMNVFNKAGKWLNGHPRKVSSIDINQAIEYVASKCEIIISSKPPSAKLEEPKDSDQRDQPVESDQRDQLVDSDKRDRPVKSDQMDQLVDSDQKDQPMESHERDKPMDMNYTNQPAYSDERKEPKDADQRDTHNDF